ncbi:MAG TPA: ROK family protein [Mesorhizobium sp.]|jgi:glucokinase|nr:ROK family protein [Mesorhizobium sp.]
MRRAIGVDIGGTSVKAGLVNESGALLAQAFAPTPDDGDPVRLLAALREMLEPLLAQGAVEGVGVSVAGFLDPGRDRMSYNANLPGLSGFPLRAAVAEATGRPARLDVDSNAGGLAEQRFGAGQRARRLLFVTVGTGVGAAVLVEGEPLRVTGECIGDPGHVIVAPGGRRCPCGARGCVEAMVGRATLEEESDLPARELIERGREHDPAALAVFAQAGRYLGLALASLAHLFQPDRIVIGGGTATVGEPLLKPAWESFLSNASPHFAEGVPVVSARFNGHEGVIGAAGLFL